MNLLKIVSSALLLVISFSASAGFKDLEHVYYCNAVLLWDGSSNGSQDTLGSASAGTHGKVSGFGTYELFSEPSGTTIDAVIATYSDANGFTGKLDIYRRTSPSSATKIAELPWLRGDFAKQLTFENYRAVFSCNKSYVELDWLSDRN